MPAGTEKAIVPYIALVLRCPFDGPATYRGLRGAGLSNWVSVGQVDEIAPGEHRVAEADDTRILVFNLDGTYYAIEDVCTHDGGILSGGGVDGDQVICPRHGARFSIRTGEALTAPAYEPTSTFPVKVENDEVFVRDDRWD